MLQPPPRSPLPALVAIAASVVLAAGAFAWTGGWFSPDRLTPTRLVNSLAPAGGPALGHRRNHAKGICFTGVFRSSGDAAALSTAQVFRAGTYPALGRFNLGTQDPNAADATVRVRGLGLQITTPDGAVWRSAMIDPPIFAVSTPQGFYDLQQAAHAKDPQAMKDFVAAHPEFVPFAQWAGTAPWTSSYAEDRFNGLNAFLFTDASGTRHAVRWSLIPEATPAPITPQELAKLGPNHLEQEITRRVAAAPQRWTLVLTVAGPGDVTADPTKAWPADRRTVTAGTLVVEKIEAEADGPCREINFDPTVLPRGMSVSDDPFPAARSAAYARSYDLRTAEHKDYPRTPKAPGGKP